MTLIFVLLACTEPLDGTGTSTTATTGATSTGTTSTGTTTTATTTGTTGTVTSEDATYIPADYVAAPPARVIFLGDSITDGFGQSRAGLEYVALLQANDGGTWPDHATMDFTGLWGAVPEVIDVATGGATTGTVKNRQLDDVAEALGGPAVGESVVVVTVAGNDVQTLIVQPDRTDEVVDTAVANLAAIVDFFEDEAQFPDGVRLYLANVYEPSDGVGQADACFFGLELQDVLAGLWQMNDAVLALAQERGFASLDMWSHFLGHGMYAEDTANPYHHADDPTGWFASDCIHPNDRGHHEIRRLFWYALAGEPFPGDGADELGG